MPSLLHIDASIRPVGSTSRELSEFYANLWRRSNPDGGYVYRDLGAEPIPHITHEVRESLFDPDHDHGQTAEQKALSDAVTSEVRGATHIVIGMPMYNYTVPSSVKAWIDLLVTPAHMVPPGESGLLSGKTVVVTGARGGAYGPGTPREGWDHQEPYLRAVLGSIGLADDLTIVHAELTLAATVPQMAALKPMGESSKANALETLKKLVS
jgi:FMN-dependent NADH-azoreductase